MKEYTQTPGNTAKAEPKKILLVYPGFPKSFWTFDYALKFISKKSGMTPLGLITIAAMLPETWEKKLIDLNTGLLKDEDLLWADYVFISAGDIQRESAVQIISRCKKLGVKTVAGGPLFSCDAESFTDVDHLLINEGELTVPAFLEDLQKGTPKHIYDIEGYPDISKSPLPSWELLDLKKYACVNIQYSRGCPYDCEFCNITSLYGHTPRTKTKEQIIQELELLLAKGWRGAIFFVDDNFIGNRRKLKTEILPALIEWLESKQYPFSFLTEVSINIADDEELMRLMVRAGFRNVFIGIETMDENGLAECNKIQNQNRDTLQCIKKIQNFGMQVQGGFIVGFDSDTPQIFDRMIKFIQESGIVTAMVGLLNAPKRTQLYDRLNKEGRITAVFNGNNTDLYTNIVPKMNMNMLTTGYTKIVSTLYSPKYYYKRVANFLKEYKPLKLGKPRLSLSNLGAFWKANLRLGFIGQERWQYWKLFFSCLFKKPAALPMAITFSIYGFHFRKIFNQRV